MFRHGQRPPDRRIDGRTARGVAGSRRNEEAAPPCAVRPRRADRQRAGANPRAKSTAGVPAPEALVRGWPPRPFSRRQLGVLSTEFGERRRRAELAAAYFSENAAQWHRIRGLYIDEREVEAPLSEVIQAAGPQDLLDIGTGTGRMLEILGPRVSHALGIDQSREMLAIARVNLERAGLPNTIVRLGDMYQLPLADASFDAVVIPQVLHYADRPAAAIAEAARVLRPNGLFMLVDFAPHELEFLRE